MSNAQSSFQVGVRKGCYLHSRIVKTAASLEIHRNLLVSYVPSQVIALTVQKPIGRTNVSISVQLDAYYPSGIVYCANFPTKSVGGSVFSSFIKIQLSFFLFLLAFCLLDTTQCSPSTNSVQAQHYLNTNSLLTQY